MNVAAKARPRLGGSGWVRIPLHNKLSEGDIREYVTRRKISGGTRSDTGRFATRAS